MKAIRVRRTPATGGAAYSATNPAPASAIELVHDLPIPKPARRGDLIVRVKASTVIRDNLTWPELYGEDAVELGNDFAGVVTAVHPDDDDDTNDDDNGTGRFRPGDEVYGMIHADRGGAWAEHVLVRADEAARKPADLSWAEAAALPLSALTADQALFVHARLPAPARDGEGAAVSKRVLVTGAAGGVGRFVVLFAAHAGHEVVAATSSDARNEAYLRSLGATRTIEYGALESVADAGVDAVIDTVGGNVLEGCWKVVKDGGVLVSIESASWDFVQEHRTKGLSQGKERVHAVFFIVEPSREGMERISDFIVAGGMDGLVSQTYSLENARAAYERGHAGNLGRGKIVLTL